MNQSTFKDIINNTWNLSKPGTLPSNNQINLAISNTLEMLDSGKYRIAEKVKESWQVNQWLKKAILLYFQYKDNQISNTFNTSYDKIPLKFNKWSEKKFKEFGVRLSPGAVVRYGSYIGSNTVIMPSFINIGSYIDNGCMIDSYATIGSCAQIGKNCHISSSAVIGGVLEPLQANPIIIEDNCFIGARSVIVEGVTIGEGAVIGMGVSIGSSTPIINRQTKEIIYGKIPSYSVVLQGSLPIKNYKEDNITPSLSCAVIVKQVDKKVRNKTSINDLLRQ